MTAAPDVELDPIEAARPLEMNKPPLPLKAIQLAMAASKRCCANKAAAQSRWLVVVVLVVDECIMFPASQRQSINISGARNGCRSSAPVVRVLVENRKPPSGHFGGGFRYNLFGG